MGRRGVAWQDELRSHQSPGFRNARQAAKITGRETEGEDKVLQSGCRPCAEFIILQQVPQLTEVVAGMQLSRGTTPSLPFAYAPALSPPSLPVFAAVVDARRADLCARAMRGLGGSSTLQQKGEGVRRKIHWMAAPNPSPSCGGGGGGGGGGVGCFDGSGGGAPKNSLDGST